MIRSVYPCLNDKWTIKGNLEDIYLLNYKEGLSEERFKISYRVFSILEKCDGVHTVDEIESITECCFEDLYSFVNSLDDNIIILSEFPQKRDKISLSQNPNYLARVLWHITGHCNCHCKHCYMSSKEWNDIEWEYDKKVIEELAKMSVCAVSLTGGEILTHSHFFDILQLLDENKIKVEGLFTNGTLLSESVLKRISDFQQIPLFVSINGHRAIVNDTLMDNDGGFDLTISNLKLSKKMGFTVFANTILTSLLKTDYDVEELYNLIKELGIQRWRITVPFLEGAWVQNHSELEITVEREISIYKRIIELWLRDNKPFEIELGHVLRYIDGQVLTNNYTPENYACDYFRNRMVIWPNGDVSPCSLLMEPQFVAGNIKTQSIEDIWESKKMRYYKDFKISQIVSPECENCEHLERCGCGCRAVSFQNGRKYEECDPQACFSYKNKEYDRIYSYLKEQGLM